MYLNVIQTSRCCLRVKCNYLMKIDFKPWEKCFKGKIPPNDMEIIFLGTSHAVPTKEKNQTSILIRYGSEGILVDCGEGTQRQFKIAGISPTKITKILITHWHGDHILGLPGLLQTLALGNYSKTLEIYGPRGTKEFMKFMLEMFIFKEKIKVNVHEISEGTFFENKDFYLEAKRMKHQAPCLAYSLVEKNKFKIDMNKLKKAGFKEGPWLKELQQGKDGKVDGKKIEVKKFTNEIVGKKISFILDTAINDNCYKISENADLLISEACFLKTEEVLASERDHLTAEQIALVAKKSKVKKLILTHISQRYDKREKIVLEEDKKIFKNSELAKDFMKIEI